MTSSNGIVARRQDPLCRHYHTAPDDAWITDAAHTRGGAATDPFHGEVVAGSVHPDRMAFGIHRAVGGDHDRPNPGDLLCAALASCLDAALRMIADRLGIEILELSVHVIASVDVRGTLLVDRDVPVGFQSMRATVALTVPEGTDQRLLERLAAATEHSCVNLQTLRAGTDVRTEFQLSAAEPGGAHARPNDDGV